MNVYKFDLFDSYIIHPSIFEDISISKIERPFQISSRYSKDTWLIPIPKSIEILDKNSYDKEGAIDIKKLINAVRPIFDFNSKLFLHSNCTIPRAKVTQKYTRVLNINKADICVVPTPDKYYKTKYVAIFLNRSKGKIYTILNDRILVKNNSYIASERCSKYPLGTKITSIIPSLKNSYVDDRYCNATEAKIRQENWRDFLEATLVYCGHALILPSKSKWVGDYLYGTMHDVVSEDKILATLGDSTNELTREIYNNISEMLNSKDSTVVGLGLKTLAELDYEKYHNTSTYLLQTTWRKWKDNKMKTNTSVKYMLKFLGLRNNGFARYSNSITSEDFNFLKEIIETDFSKSINRLVEDFIGKYPFAKIDYNTTFTIDINE